MEDMELLNQRLCADLTDAIGTALYLLEVKQDPANACVVLNDARKRSVRAYLAANGPIYDGTQPLEI